MVRYNFATEFSKEVIRSKSQDLQSHLDFITIDDESQNRVSKMHAGFLKRLQDVNLATPSFDGKMTNPFVNSFLSNLGGFQAPSELEAVIIPSKQISSLETAAGRIVEDVIPQVFGWETITSKTNTPFSEIDCAKISGGVAYLTALKSGPACINDSMSGKIGQAIVDNSLTWAEFWDVKKVHFVVGMNYSTAKNSNKKDWHILRLAQEKFQDISGTKILTPCFDENFHAKPILELITKDGVKVTVSTKQGEGLWNFIASGISDFPTTEICLALSLLSSNNPAIGENAKDKVLSSSLVIPDSFQLRKCGLDIRISHLPWYFSFYRHFVDKLEN